MKKLIWLILCLVLLAGTAMAEPKDVKFSFPATMGADRLDWSVPMDDQWFGAPSSQFNQHLAQMSISMAVSAFRDPRTSLEKSDHYLAAFLDAAGFEAYQPYGYDTKTGADTISNGIAMKRLQDDGGEYVLLAVGVCGQGYGNEWMSNFTIDSGETHQGFSDSAEAVYRRVKSYIDAHDLSGQRVKVWVTGFSRAAAVSNLVGNRLLADTDFDPDNIFIYTFGTPNTARQSNPHPQIFNICGSFDPVPRMPFTDWGYGKHGNLMYLPSRETRLDYDLFREAARENYARLMGSDKDFASLPDRNWLICELLEMMYDLLPEATVYSEAYQNAVVSAYGARGNVLDKLSVFLRALQSTQSVVETKRFTNELMVLMSLGVTDTVDMLSGTGGSSMWFSLFSSGMQLAHEHFPENYVSWIFSTDEDDLLYSRQTRYNRLVVFGNVDVDVWRKDGDAAVDLPESELSVLHIKDQTVLTLPFGYAYQVRVTPKADTTCSVGYGVAALNTASIPMNATNPFTLYEDEFLQINIPDYRGEEIFTISLNDLQLLPMHDTEGTYSTVLMQNSGAATESMRGMINAAVVMLPWMICGVVLLLYALVIMVKHLTKVRLTHARLDDHIHCRKAGKVVLIINGVFCILFTALALLVTVVSVFEATGVPSISNRTLQRAADFLGMSTAFYTAAVTVIYGCTALLCFRSAHHALSRIRLVRITCTILLLDVMTLFLGYVFDTVDPGDYVTFLIPILCLVGLSLSVDKNDPHRMVGKRWLPVSRAVFWTAVVFFVRQSHVFIAGTTTIPAVALKALSGVPVLLLALLVWKRIGSHKSGGILLGIFCYFIANTVINLSMPIGMLIYAAGHVWMVVGFLREKGLDRVRLIIWVGLAGIFALQPFLFMPSLDIVGKLAALVYIGAFAGALVNGALISPRLRMGVILFFLSNQILSFTLLYPGDFLLESVELLLYYVAVIIMAADPKAILHDSPEPLAAAASAEGAVPMTSDTEESHT